LLGKKPGHAGDRWKVKPKVDQKNRAEVDKADEKTGPEVNQKFRHYLD
jgi:hypothetical protein